MLVAVVVFVSFVAIDGFSPTNFGNRFVSSSNSQVPTMAAGSLIKKTKIKEIGELKKILEVEGESNAVNKYMNDKIRPTGVGNPIPLKRAISTHHNSVSVITEYNKKSKTGFIIGMPPPEIMGGVLRDAGAKAIIVSMDKRSGGVTTEEFMRFAKEQTRARIFTPPPIPVIWNDYIVDPLQVAQVQYNVIYNYPILKY